MITGISHVAFEVSDMEKTVAFYCDALGFKDSFDFTDESGAPYIKYIKITDNQFIELFYNGTGGANKHSYSHLCLEVDDISEIASRLKEHNITLDQEVNQSTKTKNYMCWASDPDGNRIEFMQLDPNSPQRRA